MVEAEARKEEELQYFKIFILTDWGTIVQSETNQEENSQLLSLGSSFVFIWNQTKETKGKQKSKQNQQNKLGYYGWRLKSYSKIEPR